VILATPRNFMLFYPNETVDAKVASFKPNPIDLKIKTKVV
jgi:hypothetical protein